MRIRVVAPTSRTIGGMFMIAARPRKGTRLPSRTEQGRRNAGRRLCPLEVTVQGGMIHIGEKWRAGGTTVATASWPGPTGCAHLGNSREIRRLPDGQERFYIVMARLVRAICRGTSA